MIKIDIDLLNLLPIILTSSMLIILIIRVILFVPVLNIFSIC